MSQSPATCDVDLELALEAWRGLGETRSKSVATADSIFARHRSSPHNRAYGWAALTLGRAAGLREATDEAEVFLCQAIGSFFYTGDVYGRTIAEAQLAIPALLRMNLDDALRFALIPWSSEVSFDDLDSYRLHSIASYVYHRRDDANSSLLHSVKALEVADRGGNVGHRVGILSNISILLVNVSQPRVAALACDEALKLADSMEIGAYDPGNLLCNAVLCHTFAGNTTSADRLARLAKENLAHNESRLWRHHGILCFYFATSGQLQEAQQQLEQQRLLTDEVLNPLSALDLLISEALVCELTHGYARAIKNCRLVLDQSVGLATKLNYRIASQCLSRCYAALGKSAESTRWKRFAAQHTSVDALTTIFSAQIECSLKRADPNPLTAQELECLALSARGQTSSDIALKLGIKPRTVNFHISKVLRKLHAMNRQEAIAKAISANYLRV